MNLDEVAMATPTSSTASFDWSELLDSKTLAEVFGDLSLVTGFAPSHDVKTPTPSFMDPTSGKLKSSLRARQQASPERVRRAHRTFLGNRKSSASQQRAQPLIASRSRSRTAEHKGEFASAQTEQSVALPPGMQALVEQAGEDAAAITARLFPPSTTSPRKLLTRRRPPPYVHSQRS
jgi:hypothetical protein